MRYFAFTFLTISAALLPAPVVAGFTTTTKEIVFKDAFAGYQIIVAVGENDVTRDVKYSSSNLAIVRVDDKGYATPTGNGSATLRLERGADKLEIPVTVSGHGNGRAIDFQTEIVPLLSRLGCNAGGCHGKASGQNGFKLSLFGFDAKFDYDTLTREARGRRIFPAAPERSLLLMKGAGQTPHGGGKRLPAEGAEYRLVRDWIAAGAPASAPASASPPSL